MKAVIIGNGVAGITAARKLREISPDADIVMLAGEPYHYYYRPRLPDLIGGHVDIDDIVVNASGWYASRNIEVRLSARVASVDTSERVVLLEDGSAVEYDRLLIATGADPYVPPIDGADREGVFTLRSADDAVAIREWAASAERAVVIGGGLLGLESARGLQALGLPVSVLEYADWLLPRQLDESGGRILRADVARRGIDVVTGARVAGIAGDRKVSGVTLEDGTTVDADVVLISTGVRSTVAFLEGSGIEVRRGVVVGADMQTSAPGAYAAGDAAEFEGGAWGIIPIAVAQADVAARSMAGEEGAAYRAAAPDTTLKMAGIDVYSAGVVACEDDDCVEHVRADEERGLYRKAVLRDGVIVGAIVVGSKKGVRELSAMIGRGASVGEWGDAIVREGFNFGAALGAG